LPSGIRQTAEFCEGWRVNLRANLFAFLLLLFVQAIPVLAQDGFGGEASGGAGGREVVARTPEEFRAYAAAEEPLIIRVEGPLSIGMTPVGSHKTLEGTGPAAVIRGNLMLGGGTRNVIIRNLTFTNPMNKKGKGGGDGITVRGAKHVFITKCTFSDCADGAIDVTEGADFVTISWCKFSYTKQPKHRFVMLTMGRSKKKHKNKVRVTLHHNWFAENCDQRMPAARKARVHLYNNYFNCSGNSYCSNARQDAELLCESNYYERVQNPCYAEDGGKIRTSNNIYRDCTGKMDNRNDKVFEPPYKWKVDKAAKVPEIVRAGAGAR
jgi:pectate lyase